jgi:hypothetical protein
MRTKRLGLQAQALPAMRAFDLAFAFDLTAALVLPWD